MKNLPDMLKGLSKRTWTIIGVIIAVLVLTAIYFNNRKVNLINSSNPKVEFSGYEGSGSASFDKNSMTTEAAKIIGKKIGIDKGNLDKVVGYAESGDSSDLAVWGTEISGDERAKFLKLVKLLTETEISMDKTSGLSNGDKVKLIVKVANNKENPIKSSEKIYKVHGLKKIKSQSTEDVIKGLNVSFSGFNKHGVVNIKSSNSSESATFNIKNNGKLSNGDHVTINVPESLLNQNGVKYTGTRSFTKTVNGLTDASKISNLDEVQKLTDSMMNDKFKNDSYSHYSITMVNMFVNPTDANKDYWNEPSSNRDSTSSEVTLNEKSSTGNSGNKVKVTVLYKVQDGDDDPQLEEAILTNVPFSSSKLSVKNLSTDDDGQVTAVPDSEETTLHNLNAQNVQVK